jgi:hypothetical protein
MTPSLDYFTLWGPDARGAFGVVHVSSGDTATARVVWNEDVAQAWRAVRLPEGAVFSASSRLLGALERSVDQSSAPTDRQAAALFVAVQPMSDKLSLWGMNDPDEAVMLLRCLANLRDHIDLLPDARSCPVHVNVDAPDKSYGTHAIVSRNGDEIGVHIAATEQHLRRIYEFGFSGAGPLDFTMFHAGCGPSDHWVAGALCDITGQALLPVISQYDDGASRPMSGTSACLMAAVMTGMVGFLKTGATERWALQTPRGLFVVDSEAVVL